ncbi:MAG: hypothetical protein PHZ19_02115 [Candidatus Thermoplasmatota archaeon]|nr:hypothetical protein [Candidatus Thermoplasmatota archaeon]
MKRKIRVVHPEPMKEQFQDYVFRSYEEVAEYLSIGEQVTVAVTDVGEHIEVLAGYGRVKRWGTEVYSRPTCLQPDY